MKDFRKVKTNVFVPFFLVKIFKTKLKYARLNFNTETKTVTKPISIFFVLRM